MSSTCDICHCELVYLYHSCGCENVVCLDCTNTCDVCGQRICKKCWQITKDELAEKNIEAGLDIRGSGLNLCYGCAEDDKLEELLKDTDYEENNDG